MRFLATLLHYAKSKTFARSNCLADGGRQGTFTATSRIAATAASVFGG